MNKKAIGITIAVAAAVITIVISIAVSRTKEVTYEYTPIPTGEIKQIRTCVKEITGTETLNIEELTKDQILLSDVYRYCLKTVEDTEAVLKELTKQQE